MLRFLLSVVSLAGAVSLAGCSLPPPIRVMTFNIRYGSAKDGPDRWELRRPLVLQTIQDVNPDLLGLQEVEAIQADELKAGMPAYDYVGVGRDDGARRGEATPILFRRSMFELLDAGTFWLSPTPDDVGSKGWDAALPRIATWARLRFRSNPLNEMVAVNTHFDHRGQQARLESARLLRRMVESLGGGPLILTGDFNCGPSSAPHQALTEQQAGLTPLIDAYEWLKMSGEGAGTFHAFKGGSAGERIDWILCNDRFDPVRIEIDRREFDGRFPSDHYPVHGVFRLLAVTDWGVL